MKRVLFCNRCGESAVLEEQHEPFPCPVCGCYGFHPIHPSQRDLGWKSPGHSQSDLAFLSQQRIAPGVPRFEAVFDYKPCPVAWGCWAVFDRLEQRVVRRFDESLPDPEWMARKDAAARNREVFVCG